MVVAIAHYAESIPTDAGFVLSRYASVAKALQDRGHTTHRIVPSFSHGSRKQRDVLGEISDESYGTFHIVQTTGYQNPRSLNRLGFLRQYTKGTIDVFRKIEPDIVVIGLPPPGIASATRSMESCSESQIILDVRDLWPDAQLATSQGLQRLAFRLATPWVKRLMRKDLRAADAVIGISESYTMWARRHCPEQQHRPKAVFPLGAPVRKIQEGQPAFRVRRGVVFVGSLSPLFDFRLLCNAWMLIERWRPELAQEHPLVIVGDGPEKSSLVERAMALDSVTLEGYRPYAEALEFMRSSRIGLAPYTAGEHLTIPNKLCEYLSAGLNVVTTLTGDARKLIEDEDLGRVVPPSDPNAMARAIIELLEKNTESEAMSKRCATVARNRLDRERIGEDFAEFILEVGS